MLNQRKRWKRRTLVHSRALDGPLELSSPPTEVLSKEELGIDRAMKLVAAESYIVNCVWDVCIQGSNEIPPPEPLPICRGTLTQSEPRQPKRKTVSILSKHATYATPLAVQSSLQ